MDKPTHTKKNKPKLKVIMANVISTSFQSLTKLSCIDSYNQYEDELDNDDNEIAKGVKDIKKASSKKNGH